MSNRKGPVPTQLAALAETLLLDVARTTVKRTNFQPAPATSPHHAESILYARKARKRLGPVLPNLTRSQLKLTYTLFACEFSRHIATQRTKPNPQYIQTHAHGRCCKRHGPLRWLLTQAETTVQGKLRRSNINRIAALLLRAGSLVCCPGDDIAAIGLQVYGSISGHVSESHGHTDMLAILPSPVQMQRQSRVRA
ncbi:MAG TPA: hypothetical protein VFO38_01945 [Candidatus Saccharimonadales bacterium]|nr:hypothetical protein [Candidatus Saccharimonadales bacterium]